MRQGICDDCLLIENRRYLVIKKDLRLWSEVVKEASLKFHGIGRKRLLSREDTSKKGVGFIRPGIGGFSISPGRSCSSEGSLSHRVKR